MPQSSIGIGQYTPTELTAYCHDCDAPVRAYYITKDGVPVVAVCPEKGHNRPCELREALKF